ncbi:MAG: methionyl-tRNA formyltransferase [bacterium]
MKPVNTVFIGSSYEGKEILKTLHLSDKYKITGVITQPDKPSGRKQELTPTEIKSTALELGIEIFEPNGDKEKYKKILEETKPKLIICIAFGEFIPKIVLEYPKYKCLNIHYSLLPELRGACPVQAAIMRGNKKTGVTIQVMEEKMDVGPILSQREVEISDDETTETLKEKLVPLGHDLLMKILPDWIDGEIEPQTQEKSNATYCYLKDMSKEAAKINWEVEEPEEIERKIRALSSWPVAWTEVNSKRLKIFEAELVESNSDLKPGEITEIESIPVVATNNPEKKLRLITVQLEGKNQMSGEDFFKGFREKV